MVFYIYPLPVLFDFWQFPENQVFSITKKKENESCHNVFYNTFSSSLSLIFNIIQKLSYFFLFFSLLFFGWRCFFKIMGNCLRKQCKQFFPESKLSRKYTPSPPNITNFFTHLPLALQLPWRTSRRCDQGKAPRTLRSGRRRPGGRREPSVSLSSTGKSSSSERSPLQVRQPLSKFLLVVI